MKTFTFTIFGRTFTINLGGKKKEEPKEEIKMEEFDEEDEINVAHKLVTFGEMCEEYIESQRGILAESTLKGYKNIVENHLESLMSYDSDLVSEVELQDAFDLEMKKGISEKTLKGYRSFVLKVCKKYYDATCDFQIRVTPLEVQK